MDENVPKMGPARRAVALVTLPIFLIACALLGPLALLGVAVDIYDGEVLFRSSNRQGNPVHYRWDTQPAAFLFTIGMWLTIALAFLSCVRPLYRRLKAIWSQPRDTRDKRGHDEAT